jgi:hypothetical protein
MINIIYKHFVTRRSTIILNVPQWSDHFDDSDPLLNEIGEGIANHTIHDMRRYDDRIKFLYRNYAKETFDNLPDSENQVYFMSEFSAVGPDLKWSISVGNNAPYDPELEVWNDPYRHALEIIKARKEKDWQESDHVKKQVIDYYNAQVKIFKTHIVITTAE